MSSTSIIKFDGFVENYIDEEQLRLTVKLSPTQYGPTSYEDVFQALDRAGLKAEDIRGIYKVSASDYSYSLFLRDKAPMEFLLNQKVIGKSKTKFCVISLSEQTVKLKVHWFPLFYDNRIIKAFLADFDTVLDV